ncbi:MAG: ImmA/IrrE family metallo-endopeptidase [Chloroflexi bacterium]|nr:ImmA/IrrE family metallo-endopeptidase [Chloroflexota bacterium]
MKAKILKSETEYEAALAHVDALMDAEPGSPEEAELELFAFLVEKYEELHYPIDLPDPIEAIQFRMEQSGLTRKDLAPYLGSQSKVSEVLNRKRPLSLSMIRALHIGLGIPAEILLKEPGQELPEPRYDFRQFPFTEMFNRGYFKSFNGSLSQARVYAEELLHELFSVFEGQIPEPIYCRNSSKEIDFNALLAWQARALELARGESLPPFARDELTDEFIRELVRLSYFSTGPQLAQELLNKKGIHFIVLPHLSKTYLDGACFKTPDGHPVIGMTLRYDRLDNFWFTLVHELAHIYLHLDDENIAFFDDTEKIDDESENPQEREANQFTHELLIGSDEWEKAAPTLLEATQQNVLIRFADQLSISPAIVAGRVRWERGNYQVFSQLVGNRKVRELFAEYA